MRSRRRILAPALLGAGLLLSAISCSENPAPGAGSYEQGIKQALERIGLDESALSVPKLGAIQVATPGRLDAVDAAMMHPLSTISLARRLSQAGPADSPATAFPRLLGHYGVAVASPTAADPAPPEARALRERLQRLAPRNAGNLKLPDQWSQDTPLFLALRRLLHAAITAEEAYRAMGIGPSREEWRAIRKHLAGIVREREPKPPDNRWLIPEAYHEMGQRTNLPALASVLIQLQSAVERSLPDLRQAAAAEPLIQFPVTWNTPLGKVRVAGAGPDRHEGEYLLLIDLGGNDVYENVGPDIARLDKSPRHVSVVIDLSGDDTVNWGKTPGPGAGVMGLAVWADMEGNDHYSGGNVGLGAGLFGAGLFWNAAGDDVYEAGSLAQGTGQYGLGLFVDGAGTDTYKTAIAGQGFGGPGGIGILLESAGDDRYACGNVVPDEVEERSLRHVDMHYLSMCQGHGFGLRPQASGGIGALIDLDGNDSYQADIFAQGNAYWFGLGMLVDRSGSDRYECFEHCQGESVHLGAGLLADLDGNDEYTAYEHAQGAGIDRAAGVLYDASGDDAYRSHHDSQGAGLKPYGVGLLIDESGADRYEAARSSQGFAATPSGAQGFPDGQWPVGILLDTHGKDVFSQPHVSAPDKRGRIQNRHGIAIDK
jgi:hypothetical protein